MRWLIFVQSTYFFITAVWPLISIDTFMLVTGYKTDIWLVKTVGALLIPISLCMGVHLVIKTDPRPAVLLGLLTTIAFMSIDIYYVSQNIISKIYLLDAAIELIM